MNPLPDRPIRIRTPQTPRVSGGKYTALRAGAIV